MAKKADKPIVIITGSSGKIGTALARALRNSYKIVGFDQDKDACEIPCDITSNTSLAVSFRLFKEKYGNKIAAVIHLAAYFDFTGEESSLYQAVNVMVQKIYSWHYKILKWSDLSMLVPCSYMNLVF